MKKNLNTKELNQFLEPNENQRLIYCSYVDLLLKSSQENTANIIQNTKIAQKTFRDSLDSEVFFNKSSAQNSDIIQSMSILNPKWRAEEDMEYQKIKPIYQNHQIQIDIGSKKLDQINLLINSLSIILSRVSSFIEKIQHTEEKSRASIIKIQDEDKIYNDQVDAILQLNNSIIQIERNR